MLRINQIASLTAIVMAMLFTVPAHAAPATANQSASGFLTVNGTGGADEVRLRGLGSGTIKVIDIASGNAVIGIFNGVTGVRVNLKGGENRLALTDVDIPDTLTVNSGSGDDTVRLNGMLTVGGFLNIDLAGGKNKINGNAANVIGIQVGLNVAIDTNSGNDTVGLTALSAKHVTIKTGGGKDKITVEGNSSVNRLIVTAGSGDNEVYINDTMANVTQVFSGGGDDNVSVANVQVADFMDVITGGGDDEVTTDTSTAGNEYRVNCGPGADTLTDGGTPSVVVDCETTQLLKTFNHVFLTTNAYNGNLGGLAGADAKCQAESEVAESLAQPDEYVAWLSDTTTDARDRLVTGDLPYKLVDGQQIAPDKAGLLDGVIDVPIDITQLGTMQNIVVWTGSESTGLSIPPGRNANCGDWASASPQGGGTVGFSGSFNSRWSNIGSDGCPTLNHLYCIGK